MWSGESTLVLVVVVCLLYQGIWLMAVARSFAADQMTTVVQRNVRGTIACDNLLSVLPLENVFFEFLVHCRLQILWHSTTRYTCYMFDESGVAIEPNMIQCIVLT